MSGKPRMVQPIPKATAEQELPYQQFWLCVLALYRRHTTMTLFPGQFIHLFQINPLFNYLHFSGLSKYVQFLLWNAG